MSKLLNLKVWLTVDDAAQRLSIILGEVVSEADVLRLAIDGRLQLSVYFVNYENARCGKLAPVAEAEYDEVPSIDGTGTVRLYKGPMFFSAGGAESHVLELEEAVSTLSGVYDLPMLGDELQEIEHRYQKLTNGPDVTVEGLDGSFIQGRDGKICQLLDEEGHFPSGSLPEDSVLVVRSEVLRQFEASLGNPRPLPQQRGKWTDEKLRKLWDMSLEPGMNKTMLAAHFGVTRQAIDKPLKRAEDKFSSKPKGRAFGL